MGNAAAISGRRSRLVTHQDPCRSQIAYGWSDELYAYLKLSLAARVHMIISTGQFVDVSRIGYVTGRWQQPSSTRRSPYRSLPNLHLINKKNHIEFPKTPLFQHIHGGLC